MWSCGSFILISNVEDNALATADVCTIGIFIPLIDLKK